MTNHRWQALCAGVTQRTLMTCSLFTLLRRSLAMLPLLASVASPALHAGDIDLVWPTPMKVLDGGLEAEEVFQATASGEPSSGGFGCVRSAGHKYHEGIDIKPVKRSRRGEAEDQILAAMDGVVRHINTLGGESGYGRYIVVEHPGQSPSVYTLYAHLSQVAAGLRKGDRITKGQIVGTMGNTAGGYTIPRERSHLHFEIGLCLTNNFQAWYDWKKFGSKNQHNAWNGMNLLGIDAWDCIAQWRKGKIRTFADYIRAQPCAVRLRIATSRTPDFVTRYPELLSGERPSGLLGGWEVEFTATGLPMKWTALEPLQVAGMKQGQPVVVWTNTELLKSERCRDLVDTVRGRTTPGKDLRAVTELLFNLR